MQRNRDISRGGSHAWVNASGRLGRRQKFRVFRKHGSQGGLLRAGYLRGTAGFKADMDEQQLICGGKIPLVRVLHKMDDIDPLRSPGEQSRRESEPVAELDLALKSEMRFGGEDRMAGALFVVLRNVDVPAEGCRCVLERQQIVTDIHVPVVIDPVRLDAFFMHAESLNVHGCSKRPAAATINGGYSWNT